MSKFKFKLDKSSKKYICPSCGKKTLVAYIDLDGNIMDVTKFGRCDREHNCSFFNPPKNSDYEEDIYSYLKRLERANKEEKKLYRFGATDVASMMSGTEHSTLFKYLSGRVDGSKLVDVFRRYMVGVAPNLSNMDWSIFWQMDGKGWIRTGKMIRYGADGRRSKSDAPIWYHRINGNKKDDHEVRQCLFGLHLVGSEKPIAVVESEKTAIICACFIDRYTWLATGGKGNFRLLSDLKGRKDITLFPDLGAYEDWRSYAEGIGVGCSDYLEGIATDQERELGYDLADFLLK